ncbi:glucose 1-dehydrogenase [Emcibacter sp. SYSU 3D8]|uniref:SDR family NAD(P)-dependent oxidoreductase n=1 Tax=Emcibacter sp. SYSU 3D8 TaxID=3133969 RepID=UPI0031FE80BE
MRLPTCDDMECRAVTMHDRFRLDGKVALVTGGGRGIGRGIALALAECGADVAVLARRQADVDAVAREIGDRGRRGLGLTGDIMLTETLPEALDAVVAHFGRIDIMVNNAGGNTDRRGYSLDEITMEKWDEQIGLNMRHKFQGAREAAKRMGDGGRIINVVSIAALRPYPGFGAYGTGNAGIIGMSRTLAVELAPRKITVNCIAPGEIYTDLLTESLGWDEKAAQDYADTAIPLGRIGYPEDVAAVAAFFASPAAEWTTGQWVEVSGGRS